MKNPFLLTTATILCVVLTGGMSLAKESNDETIEAGKQVAKKNPDKAKSHFNSGVTCLKAGMYKEAINEFKQAITINPDDAKAHKTLSYVYLNLYMFEDAIESSKQVLRIKRDATSHYNLGYIYNVSKDKDSALEQYEILKNHGSELADKLLRLINK